MATLNNPVNAQNIVDRYADYVRATANSGVIYHTTNLPFPDFPVANLGPADGKPLEISGSSITPSGGIVTASDIYNTLVAETNRYTRMRNLNAKYNITTGSGNATRSAADAVDVTRKASLTSIWQGNIGTPANNGVASGQVIDDTKLEAFFTTLQSAYAAVRDTPVLIEVNVCHSSCHSSCHASRGRR